MYPDWWACICVIPATFLMYYQHCIFFDIWNKIKQKVVSIILKIINEIIGHALINQ